MPKRGYRWPQEQKDRVSTTRLNLIDECRKKGALNKWWAQGGRKKQFFGHCKAEGCKKPYCAKGLCRPHYIYKYKKRGLSS